MKHQREYRRLALCLGQIGPLHPRKHIVQREHLVQFGCTKHPDVCHINTPFSVRGTPEDRPRSPYLRKAYRIHGPASMCGRPNKRHSVWKNYKSPCRKAHR